AEIGQARFRWGEGAQEPQTFICDCPPFRRRAGRRVTTSRNEIAEAPMSYVVMTQSAAPMMARHRAQETLRTAVTGLIGFLTLVDLFATQAILPSLAKAYGVTPAAMGFAVNASTMGMAGAGLLVGLVSRHLPRRRGIWMSLALLAIPTALLSVA